MIENNYLFIDIENEELLKNDFFKILKNYVNSIQKQTYVVYKGLTTKNTYSYDEACLLILPKSKLLFVNFGQDEESFDEYICDFIDDLGYLSDKYGFKEKLGRSRTWNSLWCKLVAKDFHEETNFTKNQCLDELEQRKVEILTSLIIGSINDPKKISLEIPQSLIEKIRNKIVLYDTTQSNFIYKDVNERKLISIQGLAGTGKTELLIQKIREKYVNEQESKIAFACYNTVLWEDMKKRIPELFNFMKVDEQIKINERLWIMKAWGNENLYNDGLCSFICKYYGIPFKRYNYHFTLEDFSKLLLKELKEKNIEPYFDYLFLDESQDFEENFIELCDCITKNKVYIAGDIFQNIYDINFDNVKTDYILNKCYRTDPKTLMFAHSIGLGLYEKPVIRWLTDSELAYCGYEYKRENKKYILTRSPIRRFEDIEETKKNLEIKSCPTEKILNSAVDCVIEIKENNLDLTPNDIAIIFIESNYTKLCNLSNQLALILSERLNWESNIGFETKQRDFSNKVFISNTNNVKGLEFPFVIVIITKPITNDLMLRNSIYMALTRSFLCSYLLISDEQEQNKSFYSTYCNAKDSICENKAIIIDEPSEQEKQQARESLQQFIKRANRVDVYNKLKDEFGLTEELLNHLKALMQNLENEDIDNEQFYIKLVNILNTMGLRT